jgi:hypothetical protein
MDTLVDKIRKIPKIASIANNMNHGSAANLEMLVIIDAEKCLLYR